MITISEQEGIEIKSDGVSLSKFEKVWSVCIEVLGIPDSVNNNELEVKVLTGFQKIGCELSPQDLEARPWGMPFSWENRFSNTRDNLSWWSRSPTDQ